jgi:Holliday junction DNA helicase RuvA
MIASVAGDVLVRRPDHVVIETAGGVGYRLAVSTETLRQVPAVGKPVSLLSHLVVRDDALALYGFATEHERDLFLLLVSVQSVGPKVALAVLSGGSPRDLTRALAAGDADRLQAVPGIGKRTAERIVVELREKVGVSAAALAAAPEAGAGGPGAAVGGSGSDDPRRLAREGLLELGYGPVEADALLEDVVGDSAEELLAGALRAARAA